MPRKSALHKFFEPKSVAVIGASTKPGKVGHVILRNMLSSGFQGKVYPVHPRADEILAQKCYPRVTEIEGPIDLAVVVVPAPVVLTVMEECGQKGIEAAVVISAGFKEAGPEGIERERELAKLVQKLGIRVVGPNCLGVMSTGSGLNATFAPGFPVAGKVSLISQSGALATAIIDWSIQQGIGYSKFASFGNGVDIGAIDLLRAWEHDPDTSVIVAYIEGLQNGPEFMKVARQVSARKPVIILKSGSTQAGARAVSSHTGSLAGSDEAYNAAFTQCGVIRANSMEQLFDLAIAFAYQGPPRGPKVAILTNAGGPGVMATDAVERVGLELATIQADTVSTLRTRLPAASNFYNPIDLLGDADSARYTFAAETLLKDSNVDAVLAVLTPQAMTQPKDTAEGLAAAAERSQQPVLACFMGGRAITDALDLLNRRQVPNYPYPERAVQALKAMVDYRMWLQEPPDEPVAFKADRDAVHEIFQRARREGRVNLDAMEARQVLYAYGIAVPKSLVAQSAEQAAQHAQQIGFPVVMKIISPDILHKSDIGGVRVGIRNTQEAMDAYELMMLRVHRYAPKASLQGTCVQEMVQTGREVIVGSALDPQFGPLVMFGLGGIYVEVLKDVSFRVAPFGQRHAHRMIEEIRSAPLLHGARGERPCDIDAIADCLLVVSQMVTEFPEILEMDINPLKVGDPGAGTVAVDARITIAEK
jgi:acetyl coenzyme A synthetase (ADP forming)-like protein